jgi:RNA polymerase sigma-70 factor (ECF subfamily)
VIQSVRTCVFTIMQVVCENLCLQGTRPRPSPPGRPRRRLATSHPSWRNMKDKPRQPETRPDWERLIEAVAFTRDRTAFGKLFYYFAPRVKTFMRRSGLSEADAENLAQETMLRVWRKAELYNPATAGFEAWLFTIARNLRIDALRRERRGVLDGASDVETEFLLDQAPLPDAVVASAQGEVRVRGALTELSDEQQRVVELSFFQEQAHAEIARVLGIPLGTVKSRLRLAMVKLRGILIDYS